MRDLKTLVDYRLDSINWTRFFRSNIATIKQITLEQRQDFIRQYIDYIDCFSYAAQVCEVSTNFVRQFLDHWDDNDLFYSIEPKCYPQFFNKVKRSWGGMNVFFGDMLEEDLQLHKEVINDWSYVLQNRHFTGDFIDRNIEFLLTKAKDEGMNDFWKVISFFQPNLSLHFIDKYEEFLDWELMSSNQNFSEETMLKYMDKIYWSSVLENKNIIIPFPIEKKLREMNII